MLRPLVLLLLAGLASSSTAQTCPEGSTPLAESVCLVTDAAVSSVQASAQQRVTDFDSTSVPYTVRLQELFAPDPTTGEESIRIRVIAEWTHVPGTPYYSMTSQRGPGLYNGASGAGVQRYEPRPSFPEAIVAPPGGLVFYAVSVVGLRGNNDEDGWREIQARARGFAETFRTSSYGTLSAVQPALRSVVQIAADSVSVGEPFGLEVVVTNPWSVRALDVRPAGPLTVTDADGQPSGSIDVLAEPTPIDTLAGGSTATLRYTLVVRSPGTYTIEAPVVAEWPRYFGDTVRSESTCSGSSSRLAGGVKNQTSGCPVDFGGSGLVVNSNEDQDDESPGDGSCDTGRSITLNGEEISECTLRAAIQEVSAGGTRETITFDILVPNPTITLASPLTVATSVVIDATSQPGYQTTENFIGEPVVEIVSTEAILVSASDVLIRGLVVRNGIHVTGDQVEIEQNYIGTDRTGVLAVGSHTGVVVDGAEQTNIQYNLISGNQGHGVLVGGVEATNTTVFKNIIGLDRSGARAVGNRDFGVYFLAPDATESTVLQNVISGNGDGGINVGFVSGLTIERNGVGVSHAGDKEVPNGAAGIRIDEAYDTQVTGNVVVSTLEACGIVVDSETPENPSTGTVITDNTLGMNAERTTALGVGCIQVRNAVDTTVGKDGTGNFVGAIVVESSEDTNVLGNFIGVKSDGRSPLSGALPGVINGIEVLQSTGVAVTNNVVAHRDGSGVRIEESTMVEIEENFVSDNGGTGIGLSSSDGTRIARNTVYGNAEQGIGMNRSDEVEVVENWIGMNDQGGTAAPNGLQGILINVSDEVIVWKNLVVAGLEECAIEVKQETLEDKSTEATIVDNTLGMNAERTTALGIGCMRVRNAVDTSVQGNFIAGYIEVTASEETSVTGNFIGVSVDGESPLGGETVGLPFGVSVEESDGTEVTGNVVAHRNGSGIIVEASSQIAVLENSIVENLGAGVVIRSGTGNTISRNRIARNGDLGIDLGDDGITRNDVLDEDEGANEFLNMPTIAYAIVDPPEEGGNVMIRGRAGSSATAGFFEVELFANTSCHATGFGQGELSLSEYSIIPDNDALFLYTGSFPEGSRFVSMTASDAAGNTSEFSRCLPFAPSDQFAQADVSAGATGPLFNEQGVTISGNVPSRLGTHAKSGDASTAQANAALFATRYEMVPLGAIPADASAMSADGTVVQPDTLAWREK